MKEEKRIGQGAFSINLSEESMSHQSDKREPWPLETFDALLPLSVIAPWSTPILLETQEASPSPPQLSENRLFKPILPPSSNATSTVILRDPSVFPEKVEDIESLFIPSDSDCFGKPVSTLSAANPSNPFSLSIQESSIIRDLEREVTDSPPLQSGSGKMAQDLSLFEQDVSENDQSVMTRLNIDHDEPFPPFQMKRENPEKVFETKGGVSKNWSPSSSPDPDAIVLAKREPNPTLPLDGTDKILHVRASHPSEHGDHEIVLQKSPPSLVESHSLQNGVREALKTEFTPPDEGLNFHSPKVETFKIDQQVGRILAWSAKHGEERIQVRLEPPQLGTLYIQVTKERDVLKATFLAESLTTKELLEAHQQDLRRVLEAEGFKLERFDVFAQPEADRFIEKREFLFYGGGKKGSPFSKGPMSLSAESSTLSSIAMHRYEGVSNYIDRII